MRSNTLSEQDPELRKVIKVSVTQIENELLSKLQEKRPSCTKLKRLVAKRCDKVSSSKQLHQTINMSEIQEAQEKIILVTQAENFPNEIRHLK